METNEAPTRPESTGQFALKILRELQQAIIQHEAGALAGNVEAVHDMRVGIRRLRVALSNFAACLSKKDRRRLRATLENLADALGMVRDLDVMIEALKLYRVGKPDKDRTAIQSFIRRLRARRRQQLRRLITYLHGEEYKKFKQGLSINSRRKTSEAGEVAREQAA